MFEAHNGYEDDDQLSQKSGELIRASHNNCELSKVSDATVATVQSDDVLHESRITAMQWVILTLCFATYVLDGIDVSIISYAAPAITKDWGILPEHLGLVFSSGLLGMTVGAMFFAPLADIYGRRVVVSVAMGSAGLATLAVVLTSNVAQLIPLRFLSGLGLGALAATIAPLAGEFSPRRHRTFVISVMLSGASLGPVIGGLISASLISDYGWKGIFLMAGLSTVVLGVVIYLVIPESTALLIKRQPAGALERVNRTLAYIGQSQLQQLPAASETQSVEPASVVSLVTPARKRATILIWSAFFLGFASVYFIVSWVPQILVNAGFAQEQAIQGAVAFSTGSIVGTMLVGWLAKRSKLTWIIASAFSAAVLGVVAVNFMLQTGDSISYELIWTMLFFIGVSLGGGFSNLYTVALTVYPAQLRSTGLGWAVGVGRSGGVISPIFAGFLIAWGLAMPTLFLIVAVPTFAASLCVLLMKMEER